MSELNTKYPELDRALNAIRLEVPRTVADDLVQIVRESITEAELGSKHSGIGIIARERQRQVTEEGYTPDHDDEHINGELAIAAACYAVGDDVTNCEVKYVDGDGMIDIDGDAFPWPEHDSRNQPRDRRLAIAGALIAAELDREMRKENQ